MEFEVIKQLATVYGPLALGWVFFYIALKFLLQNYKDSIQAQSDLADAVRALTEWVKEAMK